MVHVSRLTHVMKRIPSTYDVLMFSLVGGCLSVLLSGFVFGINNNVFHLAIVESLYDKPAFLNDAFIQSLRHFASGVWMLLAGSATWVEPSSLFLVLHVLSRIVVFAGALLWAGLLGVTSRRDKLLFILMFSTSFLLLGTSSYAGGGGLFIHYFTHSELANGITLFALYYAMKGKYTSSLAWNGVAFFINAFIGVWNCLPIAFIALWRLKERKDSLKDILIRGTFGAFFFLAFALPVVLAILHNPDFGAPKTFDYTMFLKEYWPFHFLFSEVSTYEKIALACVVLLGWESLRSLGEKARYAQVALAGFGGVYLLGILLPYLTHSPLLLNLHLLRVSTFFHIIAAIAVISLCIAWFNDKDRFHSTFMAPGLALLMCTHKLFIFLAPFVILAQRVPVLRALTLKYFTPFSRLVLPAAIAGILLLQGKFLWDSSQYQKALVSGNEELTRMGEWAQTHTPPDSVFLVPFDDIRPRKARKEQKSPDMSLFPTAFQRRMWVDYKTGAAVMWQPSYYPEWHTRKEEVLALNSPEARLAYAKRKGIDYVLELCTLEPTFTVQPVFKTSRLCLFQVTTNDGEK